MDYQRLARRSAVAAMAAILSLGALPVGVFGHLGDSSHLHVPGNSSTPTSAVWCVRFTQDPGAWRPDGETAVDPSLMDGTSLVFVDCAEVLDDYYAIESYGDGQVSRTTVGAPVIGQAVEDVTTDDSAAGADTGDQVTPFSVKAWTKHQKQWLSKGDKLSAQLQRVQTPAQAKKALGDFQRHLGAETKWLKANKARFEPETCVFDDKVRWEQRVKQAQKSLNKTVTAMNRGNIAALRTNIRQFGRAWTKVEQIYNIGMCDF